MANASAGYPQVSLLQLEAEDLVTKAATDLRAAHLLTTALVPAMLDRGHGRLIYLGSRHARGPFAPGRRVATNFFGQNTQAIAANQAHYAQIWAQDAGAMYGYAGSAAAASTSTPFTAPLQNTNPGGLAAQAAAVTQAVGTSAGSGVQTTL